MRKFLVRDCSEGGADLSSAPVEVYAENALEAAKKVVSPSAVLTSTGDSRSVRARVRPEGDANEEVLFYSEPPSD